jgi:SOS response regulatory protein OraA/RecX
MFAISFSWKKSFSLGCGYTFIRETFGKMLNPRSETNGEKIMLIKKIATTLLVLFLSVSHNPGAFAAAKAGNVCTKVGTKESVGGVNLTCVKSGSKLIWSQSKNSPAKENVNQSNARKKAASYLSYSAFSRSGLIKQLEFEGFSNADANYGADAQNADWNKQAVKKAANYLSYSAFSRSGLIKQLEFEGFSNSEATFGTDAQNADWNKQAAKKAASYLSTSAFSLSGLIDQLEYEGFSSAQAAYGAASTGLK